VEFCVLFTDVLFQAGLTKEVKTLARYMTHSIFRLWKRSLCWKVPWHLAFWM